MQAGRSNNFDALRLLGALLVVFSHQFAVAGLWEPRVVGDHSFGNLGVLIFFSISGYLVTSSWIADPHLGRFFARRFLRLWPGLAVAVCLCAAGAYVVAIDDSGRHMAVRYLSMLWLRMSDGPFFPNSPQKLLNGPLWTIPLEFGCYVVLAAVAALFGRVLLPIAAVGAAILIAYVATGADLMWWVARGGLFFFLAYFGAFFVAGSLLRFLPETHLPRVLLGSIPLAMLAVLNGQPTIALLCVVPLAAIAIGVRSWPVVRNAAGFGDLSYGIYLYAWPVQQLGVLWLGREASWWRLLTLTLFLTVALAFMSWHIIEKRALRLKPVRRGSTHTDGIANPSGVEPTVDQRRVGEL